MGNLFCTMIGLMVIAMVWCSVFPFTAIRFYAALKRFLVG